MRIKKIIFRNIRAIDKLELPPSKNDELPLQSILIGNNATCKTSLLRCIAIGLCDKMHASALLSELQGSLIGHPKPTAKIILEIGISKRINLEITTTLSRGTGKNSEDQVSGQKYVLNGKEVKDEKKISRYRSSFFVAGYGAGRGVMGTESWGRYRIIDAVYTMFRYDQSLQNPELIVRRLEEDDYKDIKEKVKEKLVRLLDLRDHNLTAKKEGLFLSGKRIGRVDEEIPLEAIADGYKGTFTFLCDLIGWAILNDSIDRKEAYINGVLLIDEIEQHLHPAIQSNLLSNLKEEFPDLQIIATTHSPIVALNIDPKDGTLFALKRKEEESKVELLPLVHGFYNYSAQDILEHKRLFGVDGDGNEIRKAKKKYEKLASIPPKNRNASQTKELKCLASQLSYYLDDRSEQNDPILKALKNINKKLGI